jgi:hypothetical protein
MQSWSQHGIAAAAVNAAVRRPTNMHLPGSRPVHYNLQPLPPCLLLCATAKHPRTAVAPPSYLLLLPVLLHVPPGPAHPASHLVPAVQILSCWHLLIRLLLLLVFWMCHQDRHTPAATLGACCACCAAAGTWHTPQLPAGPAAVLPLLGAVRVP